MPERHPSDAMLSRRTFLKAAAILSFASFPDFAGAIEPRRGRLLVVLLRGGMDGLFAMPPVGDPGLKGKRRNLMPDGLLKLDSFFSLHPALSYIHELHGKGEALLVHGTSIPYTGRSHFEGQDVMESGVMTPYASSTGWLGRALAAIGDESVSMSVPLPLILRGPGGADNRYPSWIRRPPPELYASIGALWGSDPALASFGERLAGPAMPMASIQAGRDASIEYLARDAATSLKSDTGPRVAILDYVGFDTHSGQPGMHTDKLAELDRAIQSFHQAMGPVWKDTLVVTVTEFGRTVAENGSWGTDHGWGTAVFVLGGALKKGGIVADWPGLKSKQLFEGRDLKATIDARSLYATILSASLGLDPERVPREVMDAPADNRFEQYFL